MLFKKKIIISVLALLPMSAFADDCELKNKQEEITNDVQKISMDDFYKLEKEKSIEHMVKYGVDNGFVSVIALQNGIVYNDISDRKMHDAILEEYNNNLVVGEHIPHVLHVNEIEKVIEVESDESINLIMTNKIEEVVMEDKETIFNISYSDTVKEEKLYSSNGEEMFLNYDKYLTDIAGIKLLEEKDSHIVSEHYSNLYHFKTNYKMMDSVIYDSANDNKVHSDIDNFISVHMLNALTQKK